MRLQYQHKTFEYIQPKMNLRLKFEIILTIDSIFCAYHAEYFITSPKFYPVQLKSVFSISVENSVDPDKMASERNMLIRISCFQKWNQ